MTPSELKAKVEKGDDRYYFTGKTMSFFGDTMANYGVRDGGDVWELYRKKPVKNGLQGSDYFDKKTFVKVFREGLV